MGIGKITVAMAVCLISACFCIRAADAQKSIEVPLPADQVWTRALQSVVLQGSTITANDRQSGIVQFAGSYAGKPGLFDCPETRGHVTKETFTGSIVVRALDPQRSSVTVQSSAVEASYRRRHFIVIPTSRVTRDTACVSTGMLEQSLIALISAP